MRQDHAQSRRQSSEAVEPKAGHTGGRLWHVPETVSYMNGQL